MSLTLQKTEHHTWILGIICSISIMANIPTKKTAVQIISKLYNT